MILFSDWLCDIIKLNNLYGVFKLKALKLKSTISLILTLAIVLTAIPLAALPTFAEGLRGDVNGDGKVSAVDARWALQCAAKKRSLSPAQITAADLSGDGLVTAVDARQILKLAAGKDVNKPSNLEMELFNLINEERTKNGVEPLKWSNQMYPAASVRGKECAELFDHTRPNGSSCFTALDECNIKYYYAAENIAMVFPVDSARMVNAWMNSEGHRNNILNPSLKYTAIGVTVTESGEMYAAQLFASY